MDDGHSAGHVILTVDYELFGDGSGSVEKCVTAPTDRLLDIADAHAAPVTLFVEALEFAAMREYANSAAGNGEEAIGDVESQIRRAAVRGHDIQLHIHPQWLDPTRREDGSWHVSTGRWRLGDCNAGLVRRMLRRGKTYLRKTLEGVRAGYRPRVFRAGGWCIQPSGPVVRALIDEGLRLDSTVAPGLRLGGRHRWYDFTDAPARQSWWRVGNDVCTPVDNGPLVEVPIAVGRSGLLEAASHLARALIGNVDRFPEGCRGSFGAEPEFAETAAMGISKLRYLGTEMLDFCKLSASGLRAVTEHWLRGRGAGGGAPIVAIGHAKTFDASAERALEKYLSWLSRRDDLQVSTFSRWARSRGGPNGLNRTRH